MYLDAGRTGKLLRNQSEGQMFFYARTRRNLGQRAVSAGADMDSGRVSGFIFLPRT